MHPFESSFTRGKAGEDALDNYFRRWFHIVPVPLDVEKQFGYDRVFIRKDSGTTVTVEYKSDDRAQDTGNAFIETLSVESEQAPGWARKCKADLLCYYVVADGVVYVIAPDRIRAELTSWTLAYPTKRAKNATYQTVGITVPITELQRIAERVITLPARTAP